MCAPGLPDTGDVIALAGSEADAAAPSRSRSRSLPGRRASSAAPARSRRSGPHGSGPSTLGNAASCWSAATRASARAGSPPSSRATSTTTARRCLFGRCYEENVVPYQPFVEAIEQYLRHGDPADVRADLVRSGTLPRPTRPGYQLAVPRPPRARPGRARHRALPHVRGGRHAARRHRQASAACCCVLDDLHWADRPTLALLGHLARHTEAAPLLILGHLSPGEVVGDHPLAPLPPTSATTALRGDHPGGLERGRGRRAHRRDQRPRAAPPSSCRSVRRETVGNPFFVQEICSHVGETGAAASAFTLETLGVPEGVKQVIGRRIARLPEGTERLLTDRRAHRPRVRPRPPRRGRG